MCLCVLTPFCMLRWLGFVGCMLVSSAKQIKLHCFQIGNPLIWEKPKPNNIMKQSFLHQEQLWDCTLAWAGFEPETFCNIARDFTSGIEAIRKVNYEGNMQVPIITLINTGLTETRILLYPWSTISLMIAVSIIPLVILICFIFNAVNLLWSFSSSTKQYMHIMVQASPFLYLVRMWLVPLRVLR